MTKKGIGIAEFRMLSEREQLNILQKEGAHVGKRKVEKLTAILFQLHSFYVEVFYKKYRSVVERLIISADPEILQPYLDQINVKGLNKK